MNFANVKPKCIKTIKDEKIKTIDIETFYKLFGHAN